MRKNWAIVAIWKMRTKPRSRSEEGSQNIQEELTDWPRAPGKNVRFCPIHFQSSQRITWEDSFLYLCHGQKLLQRSFGLAITFLDKDDWFVASTADESLAQDTENAASQRVSFFLLFPQKRWMSVATQTALAINEWVAPPSFLSVSRSWAKSKYQNQSG